MANDCEKKLLIRNIRMYRIYYSYYHRKDIRTFNALFVPIIILAGNNISPRGSRSG